MPEYYSPKISISPFNAKIYEMPIVNDEQLVKNDILNAFKWLDQGNQIYYFKNGRSALEAALVHYKLGINDKVLIKTTTGSNYISSCVTKTIEKYCLWTRSDAEKYSIILVIHEFGIPCEINTELLNSGKAIIEDCAYSTGTKFEGGNVGLYGHCALYSLTKYFMIPYGGLLVTKEQFNVNNNLIQNRHINAILIKYSNTINKWNKKIIKNWNYLDENLNNSKSYFKLNTKIVPGAYICKLNNEENGSILKIKCQNAGIESTEYYGNKGFILPVNQFLTEYELDYIVYHFNKWN